jgi:hypothetical protein
MIAIAVPPNTTRAGTGRKKFGPRRIRRQDEPLALTGVKDTSNLRLNVELAERHRVRLSNRARVHGVAYRNDNSAARSRIDSRADPPHAIAGRHPTHSRRNR